MKLKDLIKTKRDMSVWIMVSIWFAVNLVSMYVWGNSALIITNPVYLMFITCFVVYTKHNQKINNWLNTKL